MKALSAIVRAVESVLISTRLRTGTIGGVVRLVVTATLYGAAAAVNFASENLAGVGLPVWAVPLVAAALQGADKAIRERRKDAARWGITP